MDRAPSPIALCLIVTLAGCAGDGGEDDGGTGGGGTATTSGQATAASSSGGSSSAGSSSGGATSGTTGAATETGSSGTSGSTTGDPGAPHVEIADGALKIDGEPTFLYGGDLHYFRVRDPDYDAAKTHAMWAETLDLMQAAGMNLVSTYVPWDYHAPADGVFDFSGARDVGRLLEMACARGMYVVYKPGPLITAEWPRGFGTFGAVPQWWKEAHPEALVRAGDGSIWTYSPTKDPSQRQPSYLHPEYLAAVEAWYAAAFEEARPFLGKCLIAVQIDNETNLYWGNRYGDVDYSEAALGFYRGWLKDQYGTIGALNKRYSAKYGSFAEVEPPKQKPGSGLSERPKNPWYADWYAAGQAHSREYLSRLKAMVEAEGFAPPDVLHFTNDSPFALLAGDLTLQNVLLHDGPTKNAIGLAGLDLYPKQLTTNDNLLDQPFQPDYFTRLYDHYGDLATGPQDYAYAAELQGGFYAYPILGHPKVRPEATDQLLARTIGRGLKGGSFYVIRDGINADDGDYDYLAAIGKDGKTTGRYQVMARGGAMHGERGQVLLRANEVRNRVAVLTDGRYAAPQGGILDDMQRLYTIEAPAIFGWLAHAGINAEVLDARLVDAARLGEHAVVFFQNPDFVDEATAELLADYVAGGGVLVNLLWPGTTSLEFTASPATDHLSQVLFPAEYDGMWTWPNVSRSGPFNALLGGDATTLESYWYETFWKEEAGMVPFAWERTEPFGDNGAVVGYVVDDGEGTRAFLGTSAFTRYNQDDYFVLAGDLLGKGRVLAQDLCGLGGEGPIVSASGLRHLAWARRSEAALYLFVLNDNGQAGAVQVNLHDGAALGIDAGANYSIVEALSGEDLGSRSGAALLKGGVSVDVAGWSSAVVVVSGG